MRIGTYHWINVGCLAALGWKGKRVQKAANDQKRRKRKSSREKKEVGFSQLTRLANPTERCRGNIMEPGRAMQSDSADMIKKKLERLPPRKDYRSTTAQRKQIKTPKREKQTTHPKKKNQPPPKPPPQKKKKTPPTRPPTTNPLQPQKKKSTKTKGAVCRYRQSMLELQKKG